MGLFDRWLKKEGPPDNRALEACMHDLAQGVSLEKRSAFYTALRASQLILATPGLPPEGHPRTTDGGVTVRFLSTRDVDGKTAALVFTSEDALRLWRPVGCSYTMTSALNVFGMILKSEAETILINPAGPVGGRVTRGEILALAEGLDPLEGAQRVSKDTTVLVEPPVVQPTVELVAALRAHADRTIRALYLVTATIGQGAPHWLVGVDLAPGCNADDVIPALAKAVHLTIRQSGWVDFMPLRDDPLGALIRSRGLRLV